MTQVTPEAVEVTEATRNEPMPDVCEQCLGNTDRLTDGLCDDCWAEVNGRFGVGT